MRLGTITTTIAAAKVAVSSGIRERPMRWVSGSMTTAPIMPAVAAIAPPPANTTHAATETRPARNVAQRGNGTGARSISSTRP